MEEFDMNVEQLGILADELVALLPEEPSTELEAKVAELISRLVQHFEMLDSITAEPMDEEEDLAEDQAQVSESEVEPA
jgi:hypothetical protein